jgi:hypothetical protein
MIAGGYINSPSGIPSFYQLTDSEVAFRHVVSLYLAVGNPTAAYSAYNDGSGVASPLTISAIDKKIDDGVARTEKFQGYRAWGGTFGNCLTGVSGDYLLTQTREACFAEFIIAK